MKVAQLMTTPVRSCRAWDTLAVAVRLMREHACGCVVVADPAGVAEAVLTDRDVCLCALRTLRPLDQLRVHEAMSTSLHVCAPEDDVKSAAAELAACRVRRLPVVDARGCAVGLLSIDDLARAAGRDRDLFAQPVRAEDVGMTLSNVIRPQIVIDADSRTPRSS